MNPLNIREGKEEDFPALLELIRELAAFEKAPEAVTNSIDQMQEEKGHFQFFIAEYERKIAGMAVYFFAYYTWVGKCLYLDDLFVKPEFRGKKIGKTLLDKIIETGKAENCKKVKWQVLDWNKDAIGF